jgi:hypothetical protein
MTVENWIWLMPGRLPNHEIVQRLPGFVRDKFNNGRVVDEA